MVTWLLILINQELSTIAAPPWENKLPSGYISSAGLNGGHKQEDTFIHTSVGRESTHKPKPMLLLLNSFPDWEERVI